MGVHTIEFNCLISAGSDLAVVEAHLDDVMSELVALADCDPSITAVGIDLDRALRTVVVEIGVDRKGEFDATEHALSSLRAAVHAADGYTPEWSEAVQLQDVTPRRDLVEA